MYLCCCSRYENHWISSVSGVLSHHRTQRGLRQCYYLSVWLQLEVENGENVCCCVGFVWSGLFSWRLLNLTPKQFVCGAVFCAYVIKVCESILSRRWLFFYLIFSWTKTLCSPLLITINVNNSASSNDGIISSSRQTGTDPQFSRCWGQPDPAALWRPPIEREAANGATRADSPEWLRSTFTSSGGSQIWSG